MKDKETKLFAQRINAFMDREIKRSKLIYEAIDDTRRGNWKEMMGKEVKGDVGLMKRISRLAQPEVEKTYSIIKKDSALLRVINHAMLQESIKRRFLQTKAGEIKPKPLLIWGAPGVGKSTGVRDGAINAAKILAKRKNLNFKILDKHSEEFNKPIEELQKNFYFIEWNIEGDEVKNKIIFGPSKLKTTDRGTKTQVYEYDIRIPASNLFIFFDVRVSGIADSDIMGIPFRVDKNVRKGQEDIEQPALTMDRLPFLKLCCDEKDLHAVIMWDEINQGSEAIKTSLYSIVLDRKVGDSQLAPGIAQFAAANSEMWQGGELKPALANRFSGVYLWLSPEEWITTEKSKGNLSPVLEDFILKNPKVSFYVTEEGWEEHYVPQLRGKGIEDTSLEDYIKQPHKGRWPTPRDLSSFSETLNTLFAAREEQGWDMAEFAEQAYLAAGEDVGAVWAEHFRQYMWRTQAIKWETLINDPEQAKASADNTETQEGVRDLLYEHLDKLYTLSKNAHNKDLYKKEAAEYMQVLINISSAHLDFAMTAIQKFKSDQLEKKTDDPEKISARVMDCMQTGINNLPAGIKPKAQQMFDAIKASLAGSNPFVGKPPTKFAQNTPINLAQDTTLSQQSSAVDDQADKSIPEKYISFNKIFEEINNTLTPTPVTTPVQPNEETLKQKQIKAMATIAGKIDTAVSSMPVDNKKSADLDREIVNIVNREIMNDSILTKEQKQKLISVIKDVPDGINAMAIIAAYSTGNVFKL